MSRSLGPITLALAVLTLSLGCGQASISPMAAMSRGELESGAFSAKGYKAFYGIQHTHVAENGDDGQGTLAEAYAYARDKAKLDFLGISSHSHMINDQGYQKLKTAAAAVTQTGKFVAIVAQEWSSISKGGHINIYEANERCPVGNGDWDTFYDRWLPNHPEVAWIQFNHPHPSNPLEFGGKDFSPVARVKSSVVAIDKVAGMALLNGPGKYAGEDMKGQPDDWDRGINRQNYEEEYKDFLNRGWKLGAVGDQDNHVKNWGLACQTRTGVWAKSLSKAEVVKAFQERRVFATSDHNLQLWFSLNGKDMGSELSAKGELTAEVNVSDPDTAIERLELYGDTDGIGGKPAQLVGKTAFNKKTGKWTVKLPATKGESYYFAKAVYKNAWGWSSPIWVHGQ